MLLLRRFKGIPLATHTEIHEAHIKVFRIGRVSTWVCSDFAGLEDIRRVYVVGRYGLAEDTLRTRGSAHPKEVSPNELYSQSAIYIAAVHALKPNYNVTSKRVNLQCDRPPLGHQRLQFSLHASGFALT
ncbi:hypothetical protein DVH24_034887 [Malus domestica]|uniref:Uncharacterized protein n=1 Tax=Malus domestica TaxID=3750 RepID=A0A498IDD6_MALDO|nr:hypothetical protein DVH24_034887 [Malus domestica]